MHQRMSATGPVGLGRVFDVPDRRTWRNLVNGKISAVFCEVFLHSFEVTGVYHMQGQVNGGQAFTLRFFSQI